MPEPFTKTKLLAWHLLSYTNIPTMNTKIVFCFIINLLYLEFLNLNL
jgi:hypothetical protein